jgi:hypothetical protein
MRDELKVMVDASEEGRLSSHSSVEDTSQTPPPKDDEFEKFKKGRGQKIHEAFLGNKGLVIVQLKYRIGIGLRCV